MLCIWYIKICQKEKKNDMKTLLLLHKNSMRIMSMIYILKHIKCHRYCRYIYIVYCKSYRYSTLLQVGRFFIDICITLFYTIPFFSLSGPVLRAEVGDTLQVTFLNKADRNYSIQSHGLQYTKLYEGAQYEDGEKGTIQIFNAQLLFFCSIFISLSIF